MDKKIFMQGLNDLKFGETFTGSLSKYDAFSIVEIYTVCGFTFELIYSGTDKFSKVAEYHVTGKRIS